MHDDGAAALIAAAGSGERLGLGPKALIELEGRTLLSWVIDAVAPEVDEIVVAVPRAQLERVRAAHPGVLAVEGGSTRQASVAAMARAATAGVVLVHDAARPFLDAPTIRAALAAAREHGAASAVASVPDTLLDVETQESVDRERLRSVQTPQAFHRSWLLEAHAAAASSGIAATDDAGLVRLQGRAVRLVTGGAHLFKITTATDLELARAYARRLLEAPRARARLGALGG